MTLRLVADDLTGALDAAAPFARRNAPVAAFRDAQLASSHRGAWALDAATRGADEATADARARKIAPAQAKGLAFRKIDSLLRGHAAAEIAAAMRGGGFGSAVIAPAFPAQGRVTRAGRQFARGGDGAWRAVDVDLAEALAGKGLAPRVLSVAGGMDGPGVYLCDAETDGDMAAIAEAGRRLPGPVLWCGAAGLARALAGGPAAIRPLPPGPYLGVIGSRHETTALEVEELRRGSPHSVLFVGDGEVIGRAAARASQRLRAGLSTLLVLALHDGRPENAGAVLDALAAAAAALKPGALFASGGDTLAALFSAAGTERLDVAGEVLPGVPLSTAVGGKWNGVAVVSKSGAFAAAQLPARLFEPAGEERRAQA
jgi:uncharacterized protein YgbK (DUF1537 family)